MVSSQEPNSAPPADPRQLRLDFQRTYLNGKVRRYTLLFTVNGGSFAILKLFSNSEGGFNFPGAITKEAIATGAVVFTALMLMDLWAYASGMRRLESGWVSDAGMTARPQVKVSSFTWRGRLILLGISALITLGWTLAALGSFALVNPILIADALYVAIVIWAIRDWFQMP